MKFHVSCCAEIDAILADRQTSQRDGSGEKVLEEFLMLFNEPVSNERPSRKLFLVGATNYPMRIDVAARGRFIRNIVLCVLV